MSIVDFPELRSLSRPEKILLVQQLWDDIAAESDDCVLQPWQERAIAESLAEYQAQPSAGAPWPDVKQRLLSKLG